MSFLIDLKLYLLCRGIVIDQQAEVIWKEQFDGPMTLNEYASTSGICVYTAEGVYMNVPFIEDFARFSRARFIFDSSKDTFAIDYHGVTTPVCVVPVPAYHKQMYQDGEKSLPYTNLGVTHTDRCRISPIEGCAWVCTFCDLPFDFKYRMKPPAELVNVLQIAKDDKLAPARHVLISGGTPRPGDEAWIDQVYARVAKESPLPVDVMMPPRKDIGYPAWLRSVGVNMVSINLEINDWQRARRITPNKTRLFGREYYLDYIEEAVKAFGVGFVQSLMVFGETIESTTSTLQGVEELAKRGCLPVLSPFRPDPKTPLGDKEPASFDQMRRVYFEALEICERSGTGVKPGPRCIPCQHNTVAFPDGSDFYVPLTGDLTTRLV